MPSFACSMANCLVTWTCTQHACQQQASIPLDTVGAMVSDSRTLNSIALLLAGSVPGRVFRHVQVTCKFVMNTVMSTVMKVAASRVQLISDCEGNRLAQCDDRYWLACKLQNCKPTLAFSDVKSMTGKVVMTNAVHAEV